MEKLDSAQLRPTFTIPVAMPRADTIEIIRAGLVRRQELSGRWRSKGRWAELHVPADEDRVWSPSLSVRVDEEGMGSLLFGRFAPHPSVWTFFMFIYIITVSVIVFSAIFGYVQRVSGTAAWAFWGVWIGLTILALLHGIGWLGKRMARFQMIRLKAELEEVLLDLGDAIR